MAHGISFAEADVTGPDGTTMTGVSVSTLNNTLTIRHADGTVLVSQPGVTRVHRSSSKRWSVRIGGPEETPWQVLRTNCGC